MSGVALGRRRGWLRARARLVASALNANVPLLRRIRSRGMTCVLRRNSISTRGGRVASTTPVAAKPVCTPSRPHAMPRFNTARYLPPQIDAPAHVHVSRIIRDGRASMGETRAINLVGGGEYKDRMSFPETSFPFGLMPRDSSSRESRDAALISRFAFGDLRQTRAITRSVYRSVEKIIWDSERGDVQIHRNAMIDFTSRGTATSLKHVRCFVIPRANE